MARIVVPGLPHHVTQRGNRRQQTFFRYKDYQTYINLIGKWCNKFGVDILAYCLMPNHVHLIVVPSTKESLAKAIGEAHKFYTRYINAYKGWKGYLWQGRFTSFPLDRRHLIMAVKYVEQNPVRAKIVKRAELYRWSSAQAHVRQRDDKLVKVKPMLELIKDWSEYLSMGIRYKDIETLHRHEITGRPMGDDNFISELGRKLGRNFVKRKAVLKNRD